MTEREPPRRVAAAPHAPRIAPVPSARSAQAHPAPYPWIIDASAGPVELAAWTISVLPQKAQATSHRATGQPVTGQAGRISCIDL